MFFLLDENGRTIFSTTMIVVPTDIIHFHDYRRDNTKVKRMILDRVKDHIISHIVEKGTMKEMWDTIIKLN